MGPMMDVSFQNVEKEEGFTGEKMSGNNKNERKIFEEGIRKNKKV
jgi:hypothetical protein